jgi:isopenicillin N synthase-like dioxygenase
MPSTRELRQSAPLAGRVPDSALCIDARALIHADPAQRSRLVEWLRKACHETGFFYLSHAFEGSTAASDALARMRHFFSLDDQDPRKIAVDNRRKAGTYGWMPLYGEPAYQPGTLAHVESFDCGREDGSAPGKSLEGKNVWPDIPGFRDEVLHLWARLAAIGNDVLELIAESAGLERNFLSTRCDTHDLSTLRLLHYPGGQSENRERDVGIAAHTDFECVSLLMQTGPGLELTDTAGRWYDAPAHDDRIVVLIDDMLERWTNGFFKATGHRVRRTTAERYSMVMFIAVNADQEIEPLKQFISDENPSRFGKTTQRSHIENEVRRSERYRMTPNADRTNA